MTLTVAHITPIMSLIAGVLILPAYIAWWKPAFVTRYAQSQMRAAQAVGAASE